MNFIITSNRMPIGKKPTHLCPLSTLLRRFGVEPEWPRGYGENGAYFGKYAKRSLWDIWEAVRARWKKMVWRWHPDLHPGCRSSTKKFASMSEVHDQILIRLRKQGIFPE